MTSNIDKELLKRLKAAHEQKYGAPLGKRRCKHEYSSSCLGIAAEMSKGGELQWRNRMCLPCYRSKQADRYTARLSREGKVRVGPGRPPGSKNKTKKNTKSKKKSETA